MARRRRVRYPKKGKSAWHRKFAAVAKDCHRESNTPGGYGSCMREGLRAARRGRKARRRGK